MPASQKFVLTSWQFDDTTETKSEVYDLQLPPASRVCLSCHGMRVVQRREKLGGRKRDALIETQTQDNVLKFKYFSHSCDFQSFCLFCVNCRSYRYNMRCLIWITDENCWNVILICWWGSNCGKYLDLQLHRQQLSWWHWYGDCVVPLLSLYCRFVK